VFVDLVGWCVKIQTKLVDILVRDKGQGEGSDVTQILVRIVSSKCLHGNVLDRNPQTISHTLRQIGEDLCLGQGVCKHKGIVKRIEEANLNNGSIPRWFLGTTCWENNLRQVRGDTTGGSEV